MLKKLQESSGNDLEYEAVGEITKDDYVQLTSEIEALLDQKDSINLLIDLEAFKTEAPAAWASDLKFGRMYHKRIARLAIVGDKSWERVLANLADPFYARDAKFFHAAERAAAWDWLRSA